MSNSKHQRHIVVFAKTPRAGTVKTRLAASIGAARATQIYRHLLDHTLRQAAGDPRWTTWLALSPDSDARSATLWRGKVDYVIPQGRGDLGARMGRLFNTLPAGPVIIIGSDLPGLERSYIVQGFAALGRDDLVIGPAEDGGYWLIGHRRRPYRKGLFKDVRWSDAATLQDTLENVDRQSVAYLDKMRDLDCAGDLDLLFK